MTLSWLCGGGGVEEDFGWQVSTGLAWVFVASTIVTLILLIWLEAPHGKFVSAAVTKKEGEPRKDKAHRKWWWGPMINGRIGWIVQEIPALLTPLIVVFWLCGDDHTCPTTTTATSAATTPAPTNLHHLLPAAKILMGCFFLHYLHRTTTYPLFIMRGSKPNTAIVVAFAFSFCFLNGLMQALFFIGAHRHLPVNHHATPSFGIGLLFWMVGFASNVHCDRILCTLRKPGETGYKIPRGGLFRFVSVANYFSEIVEWGGYALASDFAPGPSAFAFFTLLYLSARGLQQHRWYLNHFGDAYPKERRAVIPFLL